jgi:2-C-methyl-D-erythritol 2,4-cyclodiphosphate synthase
MRIGIGYDSHRFGADRPLILGGVDVGHDAGLIGHSDADVVAHAVTDAILGAAAMGDIGAHFPPDDERWRGADSIGLLRTATDIIAGRNYQVVNVDVTVVCEAPRIGPHAAMMRERIAGALGIGPQHVSVKGKSNEGMGWIGRGEGIAAVAVSLLATVDD